MVRFALLVDFVAYFKLATLHLQLNNKFFKSYLLLSGIAPRGNGTRPNTYENVRPNVKQHLLFQ